MTNQTARSTGKTTNVLDSMSKSAQPGAKKAIQDIYNAEDRDHAAAAVKTFEKLYGAKFPKAVKKITDDQEQLLAFYDFPAEYWIHLRTTNPIESTFSTVRLRTKVTRGAGSRTAALAMVFKLVESAQQRWRAVNAPHLVALGMPPRPRRRSPTRSICPGSTGSAGTPRSSTTDAATAASWRSSNGTASTTSRAPISRQE